MSMHLDCSYRLRGFETKFEQRFEDVNEMRDFRHLLEMSGMLVTDSFEIFCVHENSGFPALHFTHTITLPG